MRPVALRTTAYPTDLNLLNQVRIVTEKIIDKLYKPLRTKLKSKPKTYRKVARKSYLKIAKQRKPRNQARKSAIKQQLQYISRNLAHIEKLLKQGASLGSLTKKEPKNLLVVTEVYRQQLWMYENKTKSVHVDKIYRTRKNRAFCQEKGIRISGVPLGRPPKNISDQTKKQAQKKG